MAEENEDIKALIPAGVSTVTKFTQEDVEAMTSAGDFLPRLSLMAASSGAVQTGKMLPGKYALVKDKDNPTDLGAEVDVLVVTWHPKAMDLSTGMPTAFYDRHSAAFKETQRKSGIKDSGCMFGPEFLLWVPSKATLATYHMGSKSARKASPDLIALMKEAAKEEGIEDGYGMTKATLKVKLVPKSQTNQYAFFVPVITKCSTPFSVAPDPEMFAEELHKFQNPPASKIEPVEAAAGDAGRAR